MAVGGGRERVLVIGDDMRIFLAVVRSLGRAGKEVHAVPFNWHSPALRSRHVSQVHQIPRYSDDPAGWLAAIAQILRAGGFTAIIPCCDRAIIPLHVHRSELGACKIAIPAADAMDTLFDKEQTREVCQQLGIPVAGGARLSPSDGPADLGARFGLPLILKPRRSYSIDRLETWGKVWVIESRDELDRVLPTIEDRSRYLVESFFEGVGVGVSVIAQDGEIFQAFQHRRLRQGKGGPSSYRISEVVHPELLDAARALCRRTNLNGVCMFEFRFNLATGKWILIETNARFWGSMPLPVSLGVDFPRYLYDLIVFGRRHPTAAYPAGVRSRNVVLDGFNLISGVKELDRHNVGPWLGALWDYATQPIRWATGKERSDSFVRDDLKPAFWECAVLWRDVANKIVRTNRPELTRRSSDARAEVATI
jgi:predicted ATP-grasp superfamily ATP-dependent carboligase